MAYSVSSILDSPKDMDPKKQFVYEQTASVPKNENVNPNKQNANTFSE